METRLIRRVQDAGFEVSWNPCKDRNCFYSAAGYQLDLSAETVKVMIFDYLQRNQIDMDGNDRLSFLGEQDLGCKVPSDWSSALSILKKNYTNSMVIQALAELMRRTISVITVDRGESYIKLFEPRKMAADTLVLGHDADSNHYIALKPADSIQEVKTFERNQRPVFLETIRTNPTLSELTRIERTDKNKQKILPNMVEGPTSALFDISCEMGESHSNTEELMNETTTGNMKRDGLQFGHASTMTTDETDSESENVAKCISTVEKQRKIKPELWDSVREEFVEKLPEGIDGLKVYVLDAVNDKSYSRLPLKDGRMWKKNSPTSWKGHERVRFADCKGSNKCCNNQCPFKQEYGLENSTQFEMKSGVIVCSTCGEIAPFVQCKARRYLSYQRKHTRVYHYGNHTCPVRFFRRGRMKQLQKDETV